MKPVHRRDACIAAASMMVSACSRSEAPSKSRVRLATTLGTFGHLPVHLANALGYFRDEGIAVMIAEMTGASKTMEALIGGSADIGTGALEQSIQMAAEGRPVQSFITEFFNFGFVLTTSPKASRPIRRIEDLKGAKIGVAALGSQSHLLVNYLLSRHGLIAGDFSTIPTGLGAANLASLEQGRVDAGITTPNVLLLLRKRHPDSVVLFDTRPEDEFARVFGISRYPSHVLFARPEWIQRNRNAVRGVARAVVRALRFIAASSAEIVISRVPAGYRSADPVIDIAAMEAWKPLYSQDGFMPPEAYEAVKKFTAFSFEKVRSAKIDAAATYTNEFVKNLQ